MSTQLPDKFYHHLVIFLMQSKQQVIAISTDLGLSAMQALTLLMLDRGATAPTMSTLCRRYDCDASNITGIIDGLEQKNLVSRRPNPKDRRVKLIHVEPEGERLQGALIKTLASRSDHLLSGLDEHEKIQFASLIEKLASRQSAL